MPRNIDDTSAPRHGSKLEPPRDLEHGGLLADRFVIEKKLGSGGSGDVYQVYDQQRGAAIALKFLTALDPASLFRFKSEFRTLANLVHPNLLQLYELLCHRDTWLLTMELIEGTDFLTHLRPSRDDGDSTTGSELGSTAVQSEAQTVVETVDEARSHVRATVAEPRAVACDEARVREAFVQLCAGLDALHRAARLHRDLKPANVLVSSAEGRVVICDFGLALEGAASDAAAPLGEPVPDQFLVLKREVAGTLPYMSPEQAQAQTLTAAADWYSVGVMLYLALTGQYPVSPKLAFHAALQAKRFMPPPHPQQLVPSISADLAELALALLHPDPVQRAGHEQAIRVFEGRAGAPRERARPAPLAFIGRDAQLEALMRAFRESQLGRPRLALVSGPSGVGKSALVKQLLSELERRYDALVLRARCYEREELAYKALDPLIDTLSSHLLRRDLFGLLPATIPYLAALFPALQRVPAIAELGVANDVLEPHERRKLAFGALRELLRNLSRLKPLLLFIDDLQWGDLDSARVLHELLLPPDAPALLVVCSYRGEDEQSSQLLSLLRKGVDSSELAPLEVVVGPLELPDARRLALQLLGDHADAENAAELIAREAEGSPLFVRELAEYVREHGELAAGGARLEALIRDKFFTLSSDARELLSVVAVAGRPIEPALLQQATTPSSTNLSALRSLEVRRLLAMTGANGQELIECYHDRIRETVYQVLPEERRRALHRRLAELLEAQAILDADALLSHWRGAGERDKAGEYALLGARKAENALAFKRAADLYAEALALLPRADPRARETAERLGHALILAGRGTQAASVFRSLIAGAPPEQALNYRMLATTQLLRAGKLADGFAELERAEDLFSVRFPRSEVKAIAMLLARRAQIRLVEHRIVRHDRSRNPATAARLEALWEVAAAVSIADFLRGGVYGAELMLRAIEAGDPTAIAAACGLEACSAATSNDLRRMNRMLALANAASVETERQHLVGRVIGMHSVCHQLTGRWLESVRLARESQRLGLRSAHSNWDHAIMIWWEMASASMAGQLTDVARRISDGLRDAEARGDVYAATSFRTHRSSWAWLAVDEAEKCDAEIEIAERAWIPDGYQFQHWHMTYARSEVDLYRASPRRSIERLNREWPRTKLVRQVQAVRSDMLYTRGRLLLAAARQEANTRSQTLRQVVADGKTLIGQDMPWTVALGTLLLAGAATFDSSKEADALLRRAQALFEAVDMSAHVAACQLRRGERLRSPEGDELAAAALANLQKLGARRPERFAALLAPVR